MTQNTKGNNSISGANVSSIYFEILSDKNYVVLMMSNTSKSHRVKNQISNHDIGSIIAHIFLKLKSHHDPLVSIDKTNATNAYKFLFSLQFSKNS
jgi:hypothetical protein